MFSGYIILSTEDQLLSNYACKIQTLIHSPDTYSRAPNTRGVPNKSERGDYFET